MNEIWKPVPGYEGAYEVSDQGQVRSLKRTVIRSNGAPQAIPARTLRPGTANKGGYPMVDLWVNGKGKSHYVHRLVLAAFVGPCPDGMEACHINGVPTDNNATNLRWDTASENGYDRVLHGTHPNAAKSHCVRGHALEDPNLVPSMTKKGFRNCLACSRAASQVKNHPERNLDLQEVSDHHYSEILDSPKLEKTNG